MVAGLSSNHRSRLHTMLSDGTLWQKRGLACASPALGCVL
jgi:hypothetical protein